MNKVFDCVEMKRQGSARIMEELRGMTVEEQLAYWRRAADELERRRVEAHASRNPSTGQAA